MNWQRILAVVFIIGAVTLGFFVFKPNAKPFKLGLDLAGGTELVYRADVSAISGSEVETSMQALREVIENRVNLFGVSEPNVQVEKASLFSQEGSENRLIVELPGVTDIDQAVRLIGKTPTLEFKLLKEGLTEENTPENLEDAFEPTLLTGRFLEKARLEFSNASGVGVTEPVVLLDFNSEGDELFEDITRQNVGRILAIFLDGKPISMPVIREEISDGTAQVSGGFTPEEARELVRNLNFGALPIPVELIGTQSIGPTLGTRTVEAGIFAGIWSFALISAFLILWYRLPGVISALSMAIYAVINLALYQFIPVTLTAAGIAGFILSVGMAVDANILVFERIKEEIISKKTNKDAVTVGFSRAWTSIRDANVTGLISAAVLFWLGTSMVKGFALTLGIGILTSMLTAVVFSRTFLLAISSEKISKFFFLTGLKK